MPIVKTRLTNAEWLRYSSSWKELAADRVELGPEIEERTESPSPLIISDRAGLGDVFDIDKYTTGYVLRVHLVATSRVLIEHCELRSEWHPDIELKFFDKPPYKLGMFTYHPTEVLNPKLDGDLLVIRRGVPVEGVILARGTGPLPPEITRGTLQVQVTMTDTLGRPSSGTIPVFLDRPQKAKGAATMTTAATKIYRPEPREWPATETGIGTAQDLARLTPDAREKTSQTNEGDSSVDTGSFGKMRPRTFGGTLTS